MGDLWRFLDGHFSHLPQPWWLVLALYEALLLGIWLLEARALRRYREASGDPTGGGRRDRRYVALWIFLWLLLQAPLTRAGRWWTPAPLSWITVGIGVALAVGGIAIRLRAIHHLQDNFSYVVAVGEGQRLVTTGPYARVRHPAYTGLVLFFLGLPLVLCDGWVLVLAQAVVIPSVVRRIRREERWMAAHFGEPFERWKERTDRLVPGLF